MTVMVLALATAMQAGGAPVVEIENFIGTVRVVEGATLDAQLIPALEVLASVLDQKPDVRLAIVAHSGSPADDDDTRAEGLAEARSIRARLIADYAVAPDRVEALWVGPFAPRATPLDATGQAVNRRIEAVLLPE